MSLFMPFVGVESDGGKDIISASQGKAKGSQAKHKSKKHHGYVSMGYNIYC